MIYPVESLIYGLFFMAALFLIIAHVYAIMGKLFFAKHWLTNFGLELANKKANYFYYIGWLFLILALAAGVTSSYIGYSDDEIAACEVSIE